MLHTEQILEFNKVKDILRTYCQTELGKSLIDELRVLTIPKQIRYRLNESNEALTIIRALDTAPLGGAMDISELVKRAEIGSILSASDLLAIKNLLGSPDLQEVCGQNEKESRDKNKESKNSKRQQQKLDRKPKSDNR